MGEQQSASATECSTSCASSPGACFHANAEGSRQSGLNQKRKPADRRRAGRLRRGPIGKLATGGSERPCFPRRLFRKARTIDYSAGGGRGSRNIGPNEVA